MYLSKICCIYVWNSQTVKLEKNSNGMLHRSGKNPQIIWKHKELRIIRVILDQKKILPEVSQYRFQITLQSHSDKTSKTFICIKIETASQTVIEHPGVNSHSDSYLAFDKDVKSIHWRKGTSGAEAGLDLDPHLSPCE